MRLIDAEHLKWNVGGIKCRMLTVDYLNWILEHEEPTVDAIPVIRCKDCKYSVDEYGDGDCYCGTKREMIRYIGDWNHYCSWAERKEE